MKNLILIIVLSLFILNIILLESCKNTENVVELINDSTTVFKDIKLKVDSINVLIKVGNTAKIPLEKDTLIVELLKISKACVIENCSTCDIPSTVQIRLKKDNITNTLPIFDLGWGNCTKSVYSSANCKLNYLKNSGPWYSFYNLIFSIKEITPYPKTKDELINISNKKQFYLNLTILNICTK